VQTSTKRSSTPAAQPLPAGRDREPQAELVGLVQAVLDAGEQLGLA
jgi:hypothetical protein